MKDNRHINLATLLMIFGMGILVAGFIAPPLGDIDNSVLIAFGEVITFAAALLGIHSKYEHDFKKYITSLNTVIPNETAKQ